MKSTIESRYITHDCKRVCQGDILRDFEYEGWISIVDDPEASGKKKVRLSRIKFPYTVILSQDCDLDRDFRARDSANNDSDLDKNQDKYLHSILLCPAYPAESLRRGNHLQDMQLKMEHIPTRKWDFVVLNEVPRYHYLENEMSLQIPFLAMDFKQYLTVPRDTVYEKLQNHYIGTLNQLFREELSQRFAYYLSRIGLPQIENPNHHSAVLA
ncbi:MAG: hypothetical protein MUO80_04425 [Dehalococcoidia bacterium]|nr:hypothetical protein [Dehalococcoidia bacterium]